MTKVNLREERESRRISIKEVSYLAGIPVQFIEALETGIVPKRLRGPILLSYKKKYLKFLDLPKDSKLRFRTTKKQVPPTRKRGHQTKTILTTTTNGIQQPSTLQSMAVGFSLAIGCIVILKMASTVLDTSPKTETILEATDTTNKKNIEGASANVAASVQHSWLDSFFQKTVPIHSAQADEVLVPEDIGSLTVYATEDTKVKLHCDEELLYNGYLKSGQKNIQICQFNEKVSLWVKDVSRVRLSFNDRLIRPMGPQDTARTFLFSR